MSFRTSINKLLDVDAHFTSQQSFRDRFLVTEGNEVHAGLMKIEIIYGLIFTLVTWFQGYYYQSWLNLCIFSFACVAYIIQQKGYPLISKLFNLFQLTIVIALMFYFTDSPYRLHSNDSVLAFYIPVSVGTLIAFQGKERKYGYLLSGLILIIVLLLISTDIHYHREVTAAAASIGSNDLLYNIVGSALATFAEVAYLLALNNRLNDSLIKANQELDNFVYIVSHDLRSPLLSTKGLLDLAKLKATEKEQVTRYLELAGKSIGNLDDLIREILEYSRNSRTGLVTEYFDIRDVIREITESLRYNAGANFSFLEEYPANTMIWSDKARLKTALRNIISNAVKYRKKEIGNPWVKISCISTDRKFTIEITDNGEGISSQSMGHVFEMFYRGTSSSQGTGLGLYICQEVLEKIGAGFDIRSTEGVGTTFTVTLRQTGCRCTEARLAEASC